MDCIYKFWLSLNQSQAMFISHLIFEVPIVPTILEKC